jgi:DNA-binding MarR family transcriptional regulator
MRGRRACLPSLFRVYARVMVSICYCDVLRTATRKTTAIYDAALAPAGVNLAQFSLLRKIQRADSVSLSELGRLAALDRSTIGRNVKVLQRMALVRVTPGEDHREATVTLGERGLAVLREAAPLWDEAQRRIEAKFGGDGAAQLQALLAAL